MKKIIIAIIGAGFISGASVSMAGVKGDVDKFQNYFLKNFPNNSFQSYEDGPYVFNEDKKSQFDAIMEFPPFEELVEKGGKLWNKPFKNGKTFASCFGNDTSAVRPKYPRWNSKTGKVETLEGSINKCRTDNGEAKWGWKKGKIAYVSAYLTTAADGKVINVVVPNDPRAIAAYEDGKKFYYAKRGQLNLSCADCHIYNASKRIRGNTLSAGLGQITHFPVWRGKWAKKKGDGFGTIQRRFGGCNKQVRAKPFKTQKKEYNNLEYFLTAMSNGMTYNGTAYRE